MEARMLTEATGKFAYQTLGEEYVAEREGAALQWGFSLGKSRVAATRCVRDPRIDYILMFCRKDNVDTMKKELIKHTTLAFSELTGTVPAARKVVLDFSKRLRSQRTKHVFLLNHDRVKTLEQELTALAPTAVIVDEAYEIGSAVSARTEAMCRVGHLQSVVFRCAMAGQFAPQDKLSYWSIFFFADKGKTFGNDFWRFKNQYFVRYGYDWILKPGAREVIMRLVADNCSILETKDVRVPKRVNYRCVVAQATAEQNKWLHMFGQGYMRRPDGAVFAITNEAVSFEKQLQVTGGYFKWMDTFAPGGEMVEEGILTRLDENPKLDRLIVLLKEDIPERLVPGNPKIVLWAFRTEELRMISERLDKEDIGYSMLSGSLQNVKENATAKAEFENDPTCRIFLSQSDMGKGLNELIVADTSIWYSNSHKVDSRMQAEARFDRPGQESNIINHIDLVLEGKEDAVVAFAVAEARIDVQGFTNAAKLMQAAFAARKFRGEPATSEYQRL